MSDFYRWTNNGVTAVVTEETFINGILKHRPGSSYPKPVFTFANPVVVEQRPYLTGTLEMMDRLIGSRSAFKRAFYVPFSNTREINGDRPSTRWDELQFCTSLEELVEAFGLDHVVRALSAVPIAA